MSATLVRTILNATQEQRLAIYARMSQEEREYVNQLLTDQLTNPWRKYRSDPVKFVEEGLKETLWSKQREILASVRDNKRTVVPACHAPGKSHIAARAISWWVSSHEPGTAMAVSTASTFRQVRNILWPHIRRVAVRHNLPGEVMQVEWRIGTELVSYGFASNTDESAVQGIHAPNLLIVVDEAGGLSENVGRALEALMTGGNTRMLVIGNPPTEIEDSWFERCCSSELYNVIPISAYDTPNFTGEDAGVCMACPPNVLSHPVTEHLVDESWVNDVITEFGVDSPFVEARVFAKFPRSGGSRVIPLGWVEAAMENAEPETGNTIRLGVDVASDGGDEFVIAWADGFNVSIKHRSSGEVNENAIDVTKRVLDIIVEAEAVHRQRGIRDPVRVKIDEIGLGWAVVSLLTRWGEEGRHKAAIIGVNVAERAAQGDKFSNQRAELWWNGRLACQFDSQGRQQIKLNIDRRTMAQLAALSYKADSQGRIMIEKKTEMKKRGVHSPDRAEAVLLAIYEPPGNQPLEPVAPVSISQKNPWGEF
jgi:hypothetical protein